jgi:hypothetical protein
MVNGEHERTPNELLAWRVRELEIIEKSQNLELAALREKGHHYVTRAELQQQASVRREWPLIAFAGLMTTCQIVTLIIVAKGGH